MPVVQLAAHAKSSTLYGRSYGRTFKFFRLDGLLLFCIIMGLRSTSCAIISIHFKDRYVEVRKLSTRGHPFGLIRSSLIQDFKKCIAYRLEN